MIYLGICHICIMIRLGKCVLGRKVPEVRWHSHYMTSRQHYFFKYTLLSDINFKHLAKVVCFLYYEVTLFSSFSYHTLWKEITVYNYPQEGRSYALHFGKQSIYINDLKFSQICHFFSLFIFSNIYLYQCEYIFFYFDL